MTVTFGGKALSDPKQALLECQRLGLDISWYTRERPNRYSCPLGSEPGRAYLLMSRANYDALNAQTGHDLVISTPASELHAGSLPSGYTGTVTLKSLVLIGSRSLTPGLAGDDAETLLVEAADRRWLYRNRPIDAAYNVRSTPTSDYYTGTISGGITAYTWAEVGSAIWTAIGTSRLGSWPGLPFTPEGTPSNLRYWGMSAWDALKDFLSRIGCALKYDPVTDTFSIVRVGVADAAFDLWSEVWDGFRVADAYADQTTRARIPASVRVLFRKLPPPAGESPWYTSTVAATSTWVTTADVESGTVVDVHDDLPAIYDSSGSLTNAAALGTRATERADDYYRQAAIGYSVLRRRYALPSSDYRCMPGSRVQRTEWGDQGRGWYTEVERGPVLPDHSYTPYVNESLDTYSTTLYNLTVSNSFTGPTSGTFTISGPFYQPTYTVTQWVANQNNFALPAGNSRLRISSDQHYRILTGIDPGSSPSGRILCLHNVGDYVILLEHESSSSTAANRILVGNEGYFYLAPGHEVTLVYDSTSSRWRVSENSECRLGGVQTHAAWGADQNDWTPDREYHTHRISGTADRSVTGIVGGLAGLRFTLMNYATAYTITLKHQNAGSAAGARFICPDARDFRLRPGQSVDVEYDWTTERWRVLSPAALLVQYIGGTGQVNTHTLSFDTTYFDVNEPTDGEATVDFIPGSITIALTDTYVGYGSAANELTGSSDFTYVQGVLRLAYSDDVASYTGVIDDAAAAAHTRLIGYRKTSGGVPAADDQLVSMDGYSWSAVSSAYGHAGRVLIVSTGSDKKAKILFQTSDASGLETLVTRVSVEDNGDLRVQNLTASQIVGTDADKDLVSISSVSPTLGGTGLTTYSTGDLIYASAADMLAKLAAGTQGKYLKQGASIPSWEYPKGEILAIMNPVATDESTTSTSYVDLSTAESVSVTVYATTDVYVDYRSYSYSDTSNGNNYTTIYLDGVAETGTGVLSQTQATTANLGSSHHLVHKITLTAGTYTIAVKHKVQTATTGHWFNRSLIVFRG